MSRATRNVTMMYQAMVKECAEMYGFDAEEAIQRLELSLSVSTKKVSGARSARGDVKKSKKQVIPLPFNAGCITAEGCQGLKPNHGLYTQCPGKRMSEGEYCSGCKKQCEKNESGKPNAGTVADRLSQGDDFKDPKGKRPQHFTAVMNKLNLTREMIESTGIAVDESHFVVPEKKGKGRPKKSKSVVSAGGDDVFGELAMESSSSSSHEVEDDVASVASTVMDDEMSSLSGNESESSSKKSKKQKMSAEEKAAKEEEKAAKKAAKEEEKAAKKAAKEEEKAAKKAAKDEEMAAKKAAKDEMAAKKAAKDEEMAAKKAAKDEEMAAKKAAKELEIAAKKEEQAKKKAEKDAKKSKKEENEVAVEEKPVKARKFTHNGVTYAKSADGRLFDLTTKDFVGTWDEEKKEIIYCDEEEEEEEESEEDDE